MSHFVMYIHVKEDEYEKIKEGADASEILYPKMAMYDENIDVEEYEVECQCVGWEAKMSARDDAGKQLNWDWSEKRNEFHEWAQDIDEDRQKLWEGFIKPYNELEEKLTKDHPLYNKPDPKCETCDGTGDHMSTYNPQSKWDWWVVGGRWDGNLAQLKAIEDPNAAYGEEIAEALANKEIYCWGLIVPDYKGVYRWSEKGKMGWFGTSHSHNDNWESIRHELLMKHKDDIFIAIDCHI